MAVIAAPRVTIRSLGAFLALVKPVAVLPHFITAAAAMFLAAGGAPPPYLLLGTLLGGGCVAAAANTINSYLDRDIDALMARTRRRPLPTGRVSPEASLLLAAALGLAGLFILGGLVNRVAVALALAALAYYILPYTLWLKRRTWWSAVIGSGAGAMPPLIGWAAVTGRIEPIPFLLAAVVVLWTLPHFWTLAVARRDDYQRAGLNVLPQKGVAATIAVCSVLLVAVSLALVWAAGLGLFYLGSAAALGAVFLYLAFRMSFGATSRTAGRFFAYSVFYIAALFAAMIVDLAVFG
jgi:protoheme IX farnesyltransferase